MVVFAVRAFAQPPRPQQSQGQQDQGRKIHHGRRIGFARLAQAVLQLLGAGTFQPAAVAARTCFQSWGVRNWDNASWNEPILLDMSRFS